MVRSLRYLFLLLSTVITTNVLAQTGGIEGLVQDATGDPMITVYVDVTEGGISKGNGVTDADGKFLIKPLSGGLYDVTITFNGYITEKIENVQVVGDKNTSLSTIVMEKLKKATTSPTTPKSGKVTDDQVLDVVTVRVKRFEKPLMEEGGSKTTLTAKEIEKMPVRNLSDIVATTPGVLKSGRGDGLNISGGRASNTLIIIDGIQQPGGSAASNLPPGSVGTIEVFSGGLPARYGDATGGVISITTKGVTSKLQGSVGGEQNINGYNNSRAYFNLSGPLIRKGDSGNRKSIMGFTLNGDYQHIVDNSPSYYDNYAVKSDVLKRIQDQPLVAVTNSSGTVYKSAGEFITKADLETRKRRINADADRGMVIGKLDFQLADNVNFTLGGQYEGVKAKNYNRGSTLFAPDGIGTSKSDIIRGYMRFTQRFASKAADADNLISNAFYTLQADYQKELGSTQDPRFGEDIFKYLYVGKFYQDITKQYAITTDPLTGRTGFAITPGIGVLSNARYVRSELNPILANYNSTVFDKYGESRPSISSIRGITGALLNGDRPSNIYSPDWTNVGLGLSGYSKSNSDQISVGIDASFDLKPGKNRHAISFGMYYQQRTERFFSASQNISGSSGGTNSLWDRARLLTNSHLTTYDYSKPYFVVNGVTYTPQGLIDSNVKPGPTDTIVYNYLYVDSVQSTFDRNLRTRLGLAANNTSFLNVDSVDVNKLSLNMFAPDELFNNGSPFVNYSGYDYTGKLQSGNASFNDFFKKRDANDRLTRPIGAFTPNYIAGYIQDNFEIGRAKFNLGVRVDRYDANTRVLKDPYSLYETVKVGDLRGIYIARLPDNAPIPSNIGSDYVIYVDNNSLRQPTIVGFRNGENWYDPTGKSIEDPTILKTYTNGSNPQPYQVKNSTTGTTIDIKSKDYDPNSSFTDYTPQVNVMPRLSMFFPIQDKTSFYAHYDVIVQRPRNYVFTSPLDYYFLANQTGSPIINNPNLRPEKLVDYEFGFQQAITQSTAVTLSLFYKERRDQIQVRPYLYASPTTYYTFGNRDFSTTKGLRVKYDFRRSGPLQFNLSYTLQFAEGTGSNVASSNRGRTDIFVSDGQLSNLISASLPNARNPYALDYDARHNIVLNLDFRYFDEDRSAGPMIFGKHPFRNAGLNLIATTISGTPYTRYKDAISTTTVGLPNTSRLPWRFQLDLSIDKDVALKRPGRGRKDSDPTGLSGKRAPLVMNFFMNIRNLLNTRQILDVYNYTQDPRDNGFLRSPQGVLATANQTYGPSYTDLYSIARDNPSNFAAPRMIDVGFRFNF